MPISQSTASSRVMEILLKSVTSWAKRYAAYNHRHDEPVPILIIFSVDCSAREYVGWRTGH